MDAWLQRVWYERSVSARMWKWLLSPLSLLFAFVSGARRALFRIGLLKRVRVSQPVIVVGNISVGGTGKTPLVIWLAEQLAERGFSPGVVTRGYGGASQSWPVDVTPTSSPTQVGDEAVLIAQRSGALVVAGPDRVAAARQAIERGADIVVCDDGLQHYRLQRDFEIAVVDGSRRIGNGWLLPAGPLRESRARLKDVDTVVVTMRSKEQSLSDDWRDVDPIVARSVIRNARSLRTLETRPLSDFTSRPIHAIAGIGNPDAFFAALRASGLDVDGRPLPDHVALSGSDLSFQDSAPVFMTEKDAVKCRSIKDERCWVVPLEVEVERAEVLLTAIEAMIRRYGVAQRVAAGANR